MSRPILNLKEVELKTLKHGESFEAKHGLIARRLGAKKPEL